MSQLFDENGRVVPVTVIQAGPCLVVQKKTTERKATNLSSWVSRISSNASFQNPSADT